MRIGLLGASSIADEAIVRPARVIPAVEVVGIAARDRDKAQRYARQHRIKQVFASYQDLIAAPEIDLVYCALPVSHHAAWCTRALEAGKHVLCEKPFAMNRAEAEGVLAVAKANDRRVIEAFHHHHHPAFVQFRRWIDEDCIGPLQSVSARFSAPIVDTDGEIRYRPELGGGAMMDLGCYTLRWITAAVQGAEPIAVHSTAEMTNTGVDLTMTGTLRYAHDLEATFHAAMGAEARLQLQLEVVGTDGHIRFNNPLAPHHGALVQRLTRDGTESVAPSLISTYSYQLAEVVAGLSQDQALFNEGEVVIKQQALLDAVYHASGLAALRESTVTI